MEVGRRCPMNEARHVTLFEPYLIFVIAHFQAWKFKCKHEYQIYALSFSMFFIVRHSDDNRLIINNFRQAGGSLIMIILPFIDSQGATYYIWYHLT